MRRLNYKFLSGDWSGTRDFYVLGFEYFANYYNEDVHYLPYGTGETFYYSLLPDSDWEPDILFLDIKDSSGNYAYKRFIFASMMEEGKTIPLGGSGASLEWNGLGNQGSYNSQPLPPGNYTVTLNVAKSGVYIYKTNQLTIYKVTNIEWKA